MMNIYDDGSSNDAIMLIDVIWIIKIVVVCFFFVALINVDHHFLMNYDHFFRLVLIQ